MKNTTAQGLSRVLSKRFGQGRFKVEAKSPWGGPLIYGHPRAIQTARRFLSEQCYVVRQVDATRIIVPGKSDPQELMMLRRRVLYQQHVRRVLAARAARPGQSPASTAAGR